MESRFATLRLLSPDGFGFWASALLGVASESWSALQLKLGLIEEDARGSCGSNVDVRTLWERLEQRRG